MDNYISAVKEIGFKKNKEQHYITHPKFHQNGIALSISESPNGINIYTSKKRQGVMRTEKEFTVYWITEQQIPLAIRSIVRFWAKNGVKLGGKK